MATFKNGILGNFNGKIGPVVGYIRRGKYVMREIPQHISPRTPAQLAVLNRMTVLSPFFNTISSYLAIGFDAETRGKSRTANNAAKSYNLKHAVKGEYPEQEIDYPAVKLSSGRLPLPENITVETTAEGLNFTWDAQEGLFWKRNHDQIMIMAFYPADKIVYQLTAGAKRSALKQFLPIDPVLKGKAFEVYISFISEDRKEITNSKYLGSVVY